MMVYLASCCVRVGNTQMSTISRLLNYFVWLADVAFVGAALEALVAAFEVVNATLCVGCVNNG